MPIIALDGPDGSSKTTQSKLIYDYLSIDLKLPTSLCVMPGATELGQELRRIIKSKKYPTLPITERLLFAADTAQFIHEVMKPKLAAGEYLVMDRWSTITDLIYGSVNGIDLDFLNTLQQAAGTNVLCDIYIIFRIPYGETARRMSTPTRPDCRIEAKGEAFLRKVCDTYNSINALTPTTFPSTMVGNYLDAMITRRCKHIRYVDASQSVQQIKSDIINILHQTKLLP